LLEGLYTRELHSSVSKVYMGCSSIPLGAEVSFSPPLRAQRVKLSTQILLERRLKMRWCLPPRPLFIFWRDA